MNISQLRLGAEGLGTSPGEILREADSLCEQLQRQGVEVKNEKQTSAGALLVGLGILAAILAAAK